MIDTKELRRLAQAATPGPWWVNQDSLNHGFECGVLEINAKDWHALAGAWGVTGAKPSEEGAANAAFIAAANPAAINELLDRLEATEKERDALRARIEALERQEPSVPDDVRKDAERYRFLEHLCATGSYGGIISRKAIDAAMLAASPEAKP